MLQDLIHNPVLYIFLILLGITLVGMLRGWLPSPWETERVGDLRVAKHASEIKIGDQVVVEYIGFSITGFVLARQYNKGSPEPYSIILTGNHAVTRATVEEGRVVITGIRKKLLHLSRSELKYLGDLGLLYQVHDYNKSR